MVLAPGAIGGVPVESGPGGGYVGGFGCEKGLAGESAVDGLRRWETVVEGRRVGVWFEGLKAMVHRGMFAARRRRNDSLWIERNLGGDVSSLCLRSSVALESDG